VSVVALPSASVFAALRASYTPPPARLFSPTYFSSRGTGAPVAAILLLHPAPTIQSPDPALPAAVDAVRTAVCGAAATAAALDVLASVRQELADAEAAMRDRADLRREVAASQELKTQVRPATLLYIPPRRAGQQLVTCSCVRGLIGLLVGCCQAEHRHAQAATALLTTQQKLQAAELSEVRLLTPLDRTALHGPINVAQQSTHTLQYRTSKYHHALRSFWRRRRRPGSTKTCCKKRPSAGSTSAHDTPARPRTSRCAEPC
jgi:hypothetical protein